jgi:hypothetical protein
MFFVLVDTFDQNLLAHWKDFENLAGTALVFAGLNLNGVTDFEFEHVFFYFILME